MKKKDLVELRNKKTDELKKLVKEKKGEVLKLTAKTVSGSEKNVKKVWSLKKEIAQLLTLAREREILEKEKEEDKNENL